MEFVRNGVLIWNCPLAALAIRDCKGQIAAASFHVRKQVLFNIQRSRNKYCLSCCRPELSYNDDNSTLLRYCSEPRGQGFVRSGRSSPPIQAIIMSSNFFHESGLKFSLNFAKPVSRKPVASRITGAKTILMMILCGPWKASRIQ